ncbi:dTDP-4-dehydrorhamnose 3,5-epimerase [Alcaligenaceae bacterium]|nr:dTDP-4-dehydrorhamnose 3,5-epimerase [Alcaligenaceae bacterium]
MNIVPTPISGVSVVETHAFTDHRGAFARLFCHHELAAVVGYRQIAQINHSRTAARGAVRGMHYQKVPHAEMKLVRCLKGRVWDVVVDLRAGSPTFLQWHAQELSPQNAQMLVIPEGCAHGFQVLEAESELLYLHTAPYCPEAEGGVAHNDPRLAVSWPLPVQDLSLRDQQHSFLSSRFSGIHL